MQGYAKPQRPYDVLTEEDLTRVCNAAQEILRKTGVVFDHPRAISLFKAAGAQVEGSRVRIPPELLLEAVGQAPSRVELRARDSERSFVIGEDRLFFSGPFGATFVRDATTTERRRATLDDLKACTRIADQLENAHACLAGVIPQDVPNQFDDLYSVPVLLEHTSKHVNIRISGAENNDAIIEMAMVASDGPPCFSLGAGPISPLTYPRQDLDKLIYGVERGIPYRIVVAPLAGATAPVTLAGCLTQASAELLAGVALIQLLRSGAPALCGSFAGVMDMRVGTHRLGAPEASLLSCAMAQICRYHHLPFGYATGGVSDALQPGSRTAIEKTETLLAPALAAADLIHDGASGLLENGNLLDYRQMLIDNELCSTVGRMAEGICVTEESLAVALIDEVGPGGKFLTHPHTVRHLRRELHLSRFWDGVGESEDDLLEALGERAREMISHECQRPLTTDQTREIYDILKRRVEAGGSA